MTTPPDARGRLFVLLRELSERIDNLAYLVLHEEAGTADLTAVGQECSAMSAALDRYADTPPSVGPATEARS